MHVYIYACVYTCASVLTEAGVAPAGGHSPSFEASTFLQRQADASLPFKIRLLETLMETRPQPSEGRHNIVVASVRYNSMEQ